MPREGYLILSVSTAILPMALIAAAGLVALWLHQLPLDTLSGTPLEVARRMLVHGARRS